MHTKSVSLDELKSKLGAIATERPQLAGLILRGESSFTVEGTRYALKGSPAAGRGFVTREVDDPRSTPLATLAAEIRADLANEAAEREYMPPVPLADRERIVAEIIGSTKKAKVGHTRIAALLEGKTEPSPLRSVTRAPSRIDVQRADQAARRAQHVQGKRPTKIAALFDGTEPKGAA